ncbi:MAG: 16S rRNA (cytosine(967)-C(5))-methyltransferase RsmB [Lachnospiraceae bacterium]|nr:16S rRNA (cytosine(967)-C(5))-methyltransferase RsmB [Lachnospiraceae bacterium]
MAENSREIVLDTLLALEREGQYSSRLLRAVLDKYGYLDVRDRAFIKRVTEGTLERQRELDYYLDHFSLVPVRKMKPLVRCLLRMSVYQLVYMDTVPDSAVCNEACKLAAKRKFGNLRGFVNGVLRNISRGRENLPLPDEAKEPVRYLAVKYSMPDWLVELWLAEYGREITKNMLEGLLAIHPVSLRLRGNLTEEEREKLLSGLRERGVRLRESSYLSSVYLAENSGDLTELPGFAEGQWIVQDVSSALAVLAAGVKEGDLVVDACAAPGGKTLLAAEGAGRVLGRDVSEEKAALIRENAVRMKAENLEIQVWDARVQDPSLLGKADVLLLDVPCSGLGVLGKKRDIKYHVSPEGLRELTKLQKEILRACAGYVKPGGTLVYSTCTINRAENQEMVRFLTEELGFLPESLEGVLPERLLAQKRRVEELQEREELPGDCLTAEQRAACIQLLPGYMEADGFFIARLTCPVTGFGQQDRD